jgi:hypothetical protein
VNRLVSYRGLPGCKRALPTLLVSFLLTLCAAAGVAAQEPDASDPIPSSLYGADQDTAAPQSPYATTYPSVTNQQSDNPDFNFSSIYRPEIYTYLGKGRETGLRMGRFRLHGALGISNTFDSNALYSPTGAESDYVLQVTPGADLAYQGGRLDLVTGYRFTYRDNLNQDIQDNRSHRVFFQGGFQMSRRFKFSVGDRWERTSDPADLDIPVRLSRWSNETYGEIGYKTPGEDLDLAIRYTNVFEQFDDTAVAALSYVNSKVSVTSRLNVSSRFRFLPKSVLFSNVSYSQTNFSAPTVPDAADSDSKGIDLGLGLSSQLTRKISVSGQGGATFIMFQHGPDDATVTGGVRVDYRPSRTIEAALGYERLAQISSFTNFHRDHRINFDGGWKFARKFQMNVLERIAWLEYSGPNALATGAFRSDFIVQTHYEISYAFKPWAKARVEYQLDYRDSNALDPVTGLPSADFVKHQAGIGFDFYY